MPPDPKPAARPPLPPQRRAVPEDADRIEALMRASVEAHFPAYYDERQTRSAAAHVARLDPVLVEDGTFLVHEVDGEIVACGGWSRRARLYTGGEATPDDDARLLDPATEAARIRAMFVRGDWARRGLGRAILDTCAREARAEGFTRLVLVATLSGVPLYEAFGFRTVERLVPSTADGVPLPCVAMERAIVEPAAASGP